MPRLSHCLIASLTAALSACASAPAAIDTAAPHIAVRPVKAQGLSDEARTALLQKAQSALARKDCRAAHDPLQALVWDNSEDDALRIELADCALSLGKVKQARVHYAKLSGPRALAGQSLSAVALGTADDPELMLNQALEQNIDDSRLWNALGHVYDKSGRYLDAQDSYIRALSAGAQPDVMISNMGMSLLLQGRYSEARDKFMQALDINPDSRTYDVNRRLSLALMGDYGAAIRFAHPDDAALIYNDAGYIAMKHGKSAIAQALFEKALDISPVYFAKAEQNLQALRNEPSTN